MAMMPPSTARIWPVMCLPAGLQKSRAAPLEVIGVADAAQRHVGRHFFQADAAC